MNLSVESRVKAHISTPYIDADGRGVEGQYAADYADCMKSPAEFYKIQNGEGKDDLLLKQLEDQCADLIERAKTFQDVMKSREASRRKLLASSAAFAGAGLGTQRERQIELDRDADSAKLDAAYHKRLESELDMDRYMRLLVKSDDAKVRDKEESVAERHARLKARSRESRSVQQTATEEELRRREHLESIRERLLLDMARQEQEREAASIQRRRQEAFDALKLQRLRDEELALQRQDIRIRQEVDSMNWERMKQQAIANAQHAADELAASNRKIAELIMSQEGHEEAVAYEKLQESQHAFEEGMLHIQKEIKAKFKVGNYLEHLMRAAKSTAEKDTKTFVGLGLLQQATLSPSPLTPATLPMYVGPTKKTIGTLTTVSEPIRPASKQQSKK